MTGVLRVSRSGRVGALRARRKMAGCRSGCRELEKIVGELLDRRALCQLSAPRPGYAAFAVESARKLAVYSGGCVRVIA